MNTCRIFSVAALSIVMINSFVLCAEEESVRTHYNRTSKSPCLYSEGHGDITKPKENIVIPKPGQEYPDCTTDAAKCRFCTMLAADPANDLKELIVHRGIDSNGNLSHMLMVSLRPVQHGQMVVLPNTHTPTPSGVPARQWNAMVKDLVTAASILRKDFNKKGILLGVNTGPKTCSGASVPEHIHAQAVPEGALADTRDYLAVVQRNKTITAEQTQFAVDFAARWKERQTQDVAATSLALSLRALKSLFQHPCTLCKFIHQPHENDAAELIINRDSDCVTAYPLDPLSSGAAIVIPTQHTENFDALPASVQEKIWNAARKVQFALKTACNAEASNIRIHTGNSVQHPGHLLVDVSGNYGAFSDRGMMSESRVLICNPVAHADHLRQILPTIPVLEDAQQ